MSGAWRLREPILLEIARDRKWRPENLHVSFLRHYMTTLSHDSPDDRQDFSNLIFLVFCATSSSFAEIDSIKKIISFTYYKL